MERGIYAGAPEIPASFDTVAPGLEQCPSHFANPLLALEPLLNLAYLGFKQTRQDLKGRRTLHCICQRLVCRQLQLMT